MTSGIVPSSAADGAGPQRLGAVTDGTAPRAQPRVDRIPVTVRRCVDAWLDARMAIVLANRAQPCGLQPPRAEDGTIPLASTAAWSM